MNRLKETGIPASSSVAMNHESPKHGWWPDLALIATATLWGTNIPIVKYAVDVVDPFVFNALRLIFATITLGCFAFIESRHGYAVRGRFSWWRFLVFASLNGLLYMLLFIFGVPKTTAGNVALLLTSMPMWTAVLSYFFIHERLGRITWMGLAVTLIGTVTVVLFGKGEISLSSSYFVGNLLIVAAALSWASGTIVSRKLLFAIGPMTLSFWSALITTPIHLLIALPRMEAALPCFVEPKIALATIYSGIFSTGVAYVFWHYGVRQLGGSHAAIYQNAVTLVAVLGGWLMLGEQPAFYQLFGGALIILGVLIMRRGRR